MIIAFIILFYVSATSASIAYAVYKDRKLEIAAVTSMGISILLQTVVLFLFYRQSGVFPIFSLKYAVFMFAWTIGIGAILVYIIFRGTSSIIGFSAPLIVLLLFVFLVLKGNVHELSPVFNTAIFPVHVSLSITAYGLFALSFISSLMYILQETWLKHRYIIWLTRWFPSLFTLDNLAYKTLTLGLFFLTIGIITGAFWADRAYGSYWNWDPKETWSLIIWLAYVFMMHSRISLGWRGKKFAWGSILCFLMVVFSFIGVSQLFKGYHRF